MNHPGRCHLCKQYQPMPASDGQVPSGWIALSSLDVRTGSGTPTPNSTDDSVWTASRRAFSISSRVGSLAFISSQKYPCLVSDDEAFILKSGRYFRPSL